MAFRGGKSAGPLLAVAVLLAAPGCASTKSSLRCRATEAIVCTGDRCVADPDGNPNAELTLDSRTGTASVCLVTACHDVRWTGRAGKGALTQDGQDFGYRLHLNGAGDEFRLISAEGTGWRGRCERAPAV